MSDIEIRFGNGNDAEMLALLGKETFLDAYHTESKLEQKHIADYIDGAFQFKVLEKELSEADTFFLVAETNQQEVGFAKLKVGSSRSEINTNTPIELCRIYLKKEFWGRSIGSILLNRCIDEGALRKCDSIWLSVWEHNARAIKFYKKFGFEIIGTHIFDLASSPQTDLMMLKKID